MIWRRGRDSNPGRSHPLNGFQDRRFRPLSHLSVNRSFIFKRRNAFKYKDIARPLNIQKGNILYICKTSYLRLRKKACNKSAHSVA